MESFHGLPRADLERIIYSIIRRVCQRFNLAYVDHHEDMAQEAWLIVYRKWECYEPRGAKFSTYIYDWIYEYLKKYALREIRAATTVASQDDLDAIDNRAAPEPIGVDLDGLEPVLLLHGMGYSDREINDRLDIEDAGKRRREALKKLALSA